MLVLGQLGQVFRGEDAGAGHVDRARDVAIGVVFGLADVNPQRVVGGVTVVQVGEQIGSLDVLSAAGEILLGRDLNRAAGLSQSGRRDHTEQHDNQQRE